MHAVATARSSRDSQRRERDGSSPPLDALPVMAFRNISRITWSTGASWCWCGHPRPHLGLAGLDQLAADIRAIGLVNPILLAAAGEVVDGRNCLAAACEIAGVEPRFDYLRDGQDPLSTVVSLNIDRRHLTAEQKRDLLVTLVKANPERSDRATAQLAKVSDKTVTSVRRKLEARSEIPNVSTRTDSKGRQQPASKLARPAQTLKPPTTSPAPAPKPAGRMPSPDRDQAIVALSRQLHANPADTLADMVRLVRAERAVVTELPQHKRATIARDLIAALGITPGNLQLPEDRWT